MVAFDFSMVLLELMGAAVPSVFPKHVFPFAGVEQVFFDATTLLVEHSNDVYTNLTSLTLLTSLTCENCAMI